MTWPDSHFTYFALVKAHTQDIALLIFSRSVAEEARRKKFTTDSKHRVNRAIVSKLVDRTRAIAARTGFPIFFINENQQRGDTFGERFANAYHDLFELGFNYVISIGNDCPGLSPGIIKSAAEILKEHEAVAGPAADGGAYLMGLSRSAFHFETFKNLAWKTASLLKDFHCTFDSPVNTLPCLQDADTKYDLKTLVHSYSKLSVARWLRELIALLEGPHITLIFFDELSIQPFRSTCHLLRGPPSKA